MEDRKTLLRYLVKRVHLDGVTETGKIRIDVEWHTGAHTATTIARAVVGAWTLVLYDTTIEPGAAIGDLSLLMKGEVLPAGTHWVGIPAGRAS